MRKKSKLQYYTDQLGIWESKLERYGRCYVIDYYITYYQNKIDDLSFKIKVKEENITPITKEEERENWDKYIKQLVKKKRLKKITPTELIILDVLSEMGGGFKY